MLHTKNHINSPSENFQSLLKVLPMFNIRLWYDETIAKEYVPYSVRIMCINCGKNIGCLIDNQTIEVFITPFVTNMVFQNFGLSWIIQSNQELNF